MKQVFLVILTCISFALRAQKNVFLDQSFWQNSPDVARLQSEIEKGNSPSEANAMGFDAVVNAINAKASVETIKFLLAQKGNDVNKPTHDARTYLFWAVSKGDIAVIEYLISKGASVNIEDSHGMTPLSFAASSGQADTNVYDALLHGGANLKGLNRDGANVLLLAVPSDKSLTLTNYFVSKGLSLRSTDAAGNTAFNYAAKSGNIDLLKTLIQKGVKYNDNAMIMASQGTRGTANTIEVYQYLEALKINPAAKSSNGENALHAIARKPNQEAVIRYFLSKGVDVNQPDNDGNTAFTNAASSNRDTATLALLLPNVKDLNQVNKKGISALAMAVQSNSAEVVAFLLGKGADIHFSDADGNNLAYYLIQSYRAPAAGAQGSGNGGERGSGQRAVGQETGGQRGGGQRGAGQEAVGQGTGGQGPGRRRQDDFAPKLQTLQDNGFDFTVPQKNGNTLYHLAVVKNDISLLKRIETLHVDVNSKNKEGLTPLHKAAMVSKDDVILKYLLSIGAKKDATTEFKETAFDLSKENEFLSKNNISTDFLK